MEWFCSTCGRRHGDLPESFGADFPDNYVKLSTEDREARALISSDQCVIDGEQFFIRGCLELPVSGTTNTFLWGLWVSVGPEDFDEMHESWNEAGREKKYGPYKGRLANSLSVYSMETANLKVTVRIRPLGQRPLIEIDEPGHPLAIEQRNGISVEQIQLFAEKLLHE